MKDATNVPLLTNAPKKISPEELCGCCCVIIVFLTFLLAVAALIATCVMLTIDARDPRVALESISISLQDDHDNGTTATWGVEVSIQNRNTMSYLRFGEFGVWVNCLSESSSQAVIPGFKLGVGDAIFVNGTVKSSLTDHARSQLVHGSVVDVLLRGEYGRRDLRKRTVKVACRDIGVGVLSGATRERKYCTVVEGFDADDSCKRCDPIIIYVRPGRRAISTLVNDE